MRKLSFAILLFTIAVITTNCGGGDGLSVSSFDPNDTIPKTRALAMYAHYMDSNVNRDDSALIRQIYLPGKDLKKILKVNNTTRVKLLIAAYLNDDSVVARRNKPTVLVQVKKEKGGTITYLYYEITSVTKDFAAKTFCPPPYGCYQVED
jgi:hypothetical protein